MDFRCKDLMILDVWILNEKYKMITGVLAGSTS